MLLERWQIILKQQFVPQKNSKSVANWIITEIFSRLNEEEKEEARIPFEPKQLAELVNLIENGTISNSIGKTVFAECYGTDKSPSLVVEEKGLTQISDDSQLKELAKEVIEANPKAVSDYRGGKQAAIGALVGQIMKATKGQANPKKVNTLLRELLG